MHNWAAHLEDFVGRQLAAIALPVWHYQQSCHLSVCGVYDSQRFVGAGTKSGAGPKVELVVSDSDRLVRVWTPEEALPSSLP